MHIIILSTLQKPFSQIHNNRLTFWKKKTEKIWVCWYGFPRIMNTFGIESSSPVLLRPTAPRFWFSSSSAFAFSLFPLLSPLSSWSDQPVDFCNFRFFLSAYNFDICHGPLRWLRGYGHYPIGCLCSLVCSSSIGPLSSLGRPAYFSKGDRC